MTLATGEDLSLRDKPPSMPSQGSSRFTEQDLKTDPRMRGWGGGAGWNADQLDGPELVDCWRIFSFEMLLIFAQRDSG